MKRIIISAALAFAFAARVFYPTPALADSPQPLSMTSTSNCVSPPNPLGTTGIQVSGSSWTGNMSIQGSADASHWSPINGVIPSTGAQSTTISANGLYRVSSAGTQGLRVCVNTTGTGTAEVAFTSSQASGLPDLPLQTVVTGPGASSGNPLYTSTSATICDPELITQCAGVNPQGEEFTTDPDVVSMGNSLALGSTSNAVTAATNFNSISRFQITGTWTGTLIFEGTTNNSNWVSLNNTISAGNGTIGATTTANGVYRVDSAGYTQVRVRVSTTGTGTATVAYDLSAAVVSPAQLFDSGGNQYVLPRNGANAMAIDANGVQAHKLCDATTSTQCGAVSSAGALSNNLTQVGSSNLTLGQKAMAASVPVAIASDQTAVTANAGTGTFNINIGQVGGSPVSAGGPISVTSSFPYDYTSSQTGVANSGLLAEGYTGTVVHPIHLNANGVVNMDFCNTTATTCSGIGQATSANSMSIVPASDSANFPVNINANSLDPCANAANYTAENINISSATTTKVVPLSSGKKTYLCTGNLLVNGTNTITVKYGTQTTNPCDTGTGYVVGAASNVGYDFSNNNGDGIVLPRLSWIIPASQDVCFDTSTTAHVSGSLQVVQQ